MKIGVARLTLRIPQSQSLKAKRKILRSILDKTRAKFRVCIAETGLQNKLQSCQIGIACVSSEAKHADEIIQKTIRFIENTHLASMTHCRTEIIHMGDTWDESEYPEYHDFLDESILHHEDQ